VLVLVGEDGDDEEDGFFDVEEERGRVSMRDLYGVFGRWFEG
jgi:hypothetical protein